MPYEWQKQVFGSILECQWKCWSWKWSKWLMQRNHDRRLYAQNLQMFSKEAELRHICKLEWWCRNIFWGKFSNWYRDLSISFLHWKRWWGQCQSRDLRCTQIANQLICTERKYEENVVKLQFLREIIFYEVTIKSKPLNSRN